MKMELFAWQCETFFKSKNPCSPLTEMRGQTPPPLPWNVFNYQLYHVMLHVWCTKLLLITVRGLGIWISWVNTSLWFLNSSNSLTFLNSWIRDSLCYLTIKSDTGQHSQFLRCFSMNLSLSFNVGYLPSSARSKWHTVHGKTAWK